MGTTLTGTTPQDTYDSLIKVTDNGPLSGTAKYLSDGLGNDSVLALSTSRVGVGTTSPSVALHTNGVIRSANSGNTVFTEVQNDGVYATATDLYLLAPSTKFVSLYAGGAEAMRITSTGNVGIGTSSPDGKLDVSSAGNLVSTGVFTNPNLALTLNASPVDNDTFAGITFATSDSSNYGWSLGAKRETGGNGFLEIRQHFNSATGTQIARFTSNGLCFGSDTAAANALDDYEEGTWSPVITDLTTDATMIAGSGGTYTKIGRQVTLTGYVRTSSISGLSGDIYIKGLPFSVGGSTVGGVSLAFGFGTNFNITAGQSVGGYSEGGTRITLTVWDSTAGTTTMQASEWTSLGFIFMSFTYFV